MAIEIMCCLCNTPIVNGRGVVHVQMRDVECAKETERHHSDPHGMTLFELGGSPPQWRGVHFECAPGGEIGAYAIDVEELRSEHDLLKSTACLLAKNWIQMTDWAVLIDAYANGDMSGVFREV